MWFRKMDAVALCAGLYGRHKNIISGMNPDRGSEEYGIEFPRFFLLPKYTKQHSLQDKVSHHRMVV
jgi:hypothetical protein